MTKKTRRSFWHEYFPLSLHDTLVFFTGMVCATFVCVLMHWQGTVDGSYSLIYILAILVVSRLTSGYFYGLLSSLLSVVAVNYVFTFPYMQLNFTLTGYPLTFFSMLCVAIITCTLTSKIKRQEQIHMEMEKEKMRATLLRAISHDLRTPLTSIIGSTSVVLDNEDTLPPEKKRELLSDVIDESQWLIKMVENLLSITRISGEDAKISKREEIVDEVLSETVRTFKSRYPNAILKVSVPDEILLVPMDALLIEQLLFNLLENAVIHGGNVSLITLSVTDVGGFAKFSVIDDGNGISEELFPSLFKDTSWFNDGDRSDVKRNMGLGLSVCQSIVQIHGGTIYAENSPSGGAAFHFLLPLENESSVSV